MTHGTTPAAMNLYERIYAWVAMLIVACAALWCAVNLIAIWPTVETTLVEQRPVQTSAGTNGQSPAPPTSPPSSPLKPPLKDSVVIRRHWTGGTDLWMSPINISAPLTPDVRVLLLALLAGALGAAIHIFSSLSGFVGNRTFKVSWLMWYILRMPTGALLGLFLTLGLQGGLPVEQVSFDGANPFQMCFLAGLAGLFSRNALDKLEDVFETLFKTDKNDDRKDNMDSSTTKKDGK